MDRRRAFILLAVVVAGMGLAAGERISDLQWLAFLAAAGVVLLVAIWPRLPPETPVTARTTVELGTLFVALFALAMVQLLRTQVVLSGAISRRSGVDAASGDVLGNPRLAMGELRVRRGAIRDRTGAALAESVPEPDGVTFRRVVPDLAAAEVVGYFSPLLYGTSALERAYDDERSGRAGPGEWRRARDGLLGLPRQGLDLRLSLDLGLQRLAHELLMGRPGGVVLLDARTGAVLAMASAPGIDPNLLDTDAEAGRAAAEAAWAGYLADDLAPLLLRPAQGAWPPGSTFTVITAAAAIDQGVADPATVYEDAGELVVNGRVIPENNRPDETRDAWTLTEALGWSLNVVFAQVGLQLGGDALRRAAEAWGFGADIPFDLPVTPSQVSADREFLDDPVAVAETAFGQGELLATTLQMALVAAGIANGGTVMRPWLVKSMSRRDGPEVWRVEPSAWRRPVRPETAAAVAAMMEWAVTEGGILGGAVPGYRSGGKTGTAETGEGEPTHGWYIGFAGDGERMLAVGVTVERGGSGGESAMPVGQRMLAEGIGQRVSGIGENG
ncbi:MAG: penicillin-binding transpeptidase domain-containing protein [Chloroflexota bacterium]